MKQNNENTNAFLIHISAFGGFFFPFGSIITPLIVWQTLKDRSQFLDEQGREAVNFNITYSLYAFILSLAVIPFVIGNLFSNWNRHSFHNGNWDLNFDIGFGNFYGIIGFASFAGIIGIIRIILVILAAVKANKGEAYRYPLTIKFFK